MTKVKFIEVEADNISITGLNRGDSIIINDPRKATIVKLVNEK